MPPKGGGADISWVTEREKSWQGEAGRAAGETHVAQSHMTEKEALEEGPAGEQVDGRPGEGPGEGVNRCTAR